MGLLYIIFKPSGSLESFFGRFDSRNEGMSVLTSRTIDSGIRSICHMVVPSCLKQLKLAPGTERQVLKKKRNSQQFLSNTGELQTESVGQGGRAVNLFRAAAA